MSLSLTIIVLLITTVISIIGFSNRNIFDGLKFNAFLIYHNRQVWRFLTSAFIHVDFIHLVINMYVLYMFGPHVESFIIGLFPSSLLGKFLYLLLFGGATVLSSFYSFEKHKHDLWYNAVGASGAISAIVFSFIAIYPLKSLYFIFLPGVPIPAFILGILYLLYSWYMARKKVDQIGHDAHFFGSLFGFLFMFIIDPPLFLKFIDAITSFL